MLLLLSMARQASACPFCESETGKQVRAEIFGDDFLLNAAMTLMPFPFLLGIIGLIYFGPPWPLRRR